MHDLPDLDVDLGLPASADYSTVAGLVLKVLGRVPERPGDVVEVGGWTIEVAAVARHAVTEVRLRPRSAGVSTRHTGAVDGSDVVLAGRDDADDRVGDRGDLTWAGAWVAPAHCPSR